jgi:hypothetical protein
MSIEMRWYDSSRRIIWINLAPPWTWKEFAALNDRSIEFVSTVSHRVCYLVDMTDLRHLPPGLPLSAIYPVLSIDHPNTDSYVIVGAQPAIRKTLGILLRVMRLSTHITLVNTIDEGLQVIQTRLSALNGGT